MRVEEARHRGNGITIEVAGAPLPDADPTVVVARLADGNRHTRRFAVGSPETVQVLEATLGAGRSNGHGPAELRAEIRASAVPRHVRALAPDDVYVVIDPDAEDDGIADLGARLLMDGLPVHLVVPGRGAPSVCATVGRLGRHTCISLSPVTEGRAAAALRRAADVVGAGVLLAVLLPLLALVGGLVWCTTGAPVIYAHERVGRFGKRFTVYKFRSMVSDADRILRRSPAIYRRYVAANYKLPEAEDPRITRLGRFLRRTSIDELPQLWNVFRGDMSLVGPRPVVPEELAEYREYDRLLLRVRPGLTGAWQVGGRSLISYPERARIDLQYVATRSVPDDVRILVRTVPAVLRRRGVV
jgi:exopolysaccharide production protein ExoY